MSDFFEVFVCSDKNEYSVIVEDDGKVAYAYLLLNDKIVSDVWLYNQAATPQITIWEKNKMPFLNTAEFVDDIHIIPPITDLAEVAISFELSDDMKELAEVRVIIRGKLIAVMKSNTKPGWSTIVKKDGPLAKIY